MSASSWARISRTNQASSSRMGAPYPKHRFPAACVACGGKPPLVRPGTSQPEEPPMTSPSMQPASAPRPSLRFPRALAGLATLVLDLALALPAAAQAPPLRHHVVGDTTAPTPGKVQPGLMLM